MVRTWTKPGFWFGFGYQNFGFSGLDPDFDFGFFGSKLKTLPENPKNLKSKPDYPKNPKFKIGPKPKNLKFWNPNPIRKPVSV